MVGGVVGMLQPGVQAQNAAPSSVVQPQVPGALSTQRWRFCPIPTAALALFPILLSSQTDSLAVCRPGRHSDTPDPPSLWFSNCRKVH